MAITKAKQHYVNQTVLYCCPQCSYHFCYIDVSKAVGLDWTETRESVLRSDPVALG